MPDHNIAIRARALRALHAEGRKRGLDHDGLREIFHARSLADVPVEQLLGMLKERTGRGIRRVRAGKRTTPLPRRGYADSGEIEMVSGEDLNTLAEAFAQRGLEREAQRNFIRRQLGGRETIRTRKDFHRVFSGIRAMNRRAEKEESK